jgi:predicted RNA-binding Zn-ribbon protein involved in translation (DUF1610 family)
MNSEKGGTCWNCGSELTPMEYGRQDTCRKCGRDTKVCKNCELHDRSYNNECRESQADRVVEKEKSNFCDYFNPRSGGGGQSRDAQNAAKAAADALFKSNS